MKNISIKPSYEGFEEMLLNATSISAKTIHDSLDKALKECLIPQVGCGSIEYTIDGEALYNRIKGIKDTLI